MELRALICIASLLDAFMATSCCLFVVAPHRSAFAVAHASKSSSFAATHHRLNETFNRAYRCGSVESLFCYVLSVARGLVELP